MYSPRLSASRAARNSESSGVPCSGLVRLSLPPASSAAPTKKGTGEAKVRRGSCASSKECSYISQPGSTRVKLGCARSEISGVYTIGSGMNSHVAIGTGVMWVATGALRGDVPGRGTGVGAGVCAAAEAAISVSNRNWGMRMAIAPPVMAARWNSPRAIREGAGGPPADLGSGR